MARGPPIRNPFLFLNDSETWTFQSLSCNNITHPPAHAHAAPLELLPTVTQSACQGTEI